MSNVIQKIITPNDKSLGSIFNSTSAFNIDIYQRDYKWQVDNVKTLLNDIEVRFLQGKITESDTKKILKDVNENFEPYFLNSFLTSTTSESTYIVDGQQRLTTFLIIFIELYLIIKLQKEQNPEIKIFDLEFMKKLIYESDPFGNIDHFKIYNSNRQDAFKAIIDGELEKFQQKDETQKRICENYKFIEDYFDDFFYNKERVFDSDKFNYYVSYILNKLVIIEVEITKKENVAMIFEVVNDRGLGLKPYEILKGKLLGLLDGKQKEKANDKWTEIINKFYEEGIDPDDFFKIYLRSKFAESESEYEKFEKKYHYEMYTNQKVKAFFGDFKSPELLFKIVTETLPYFANLYSKLRKSENFEFITYNRILEQNQQYLLLMSSVCLNDAHEDDKINAISKKFDQFHIIQRLLNYYDSNDFQWYIHELNKGIREKSIDDAIPFFDTLLLKDLEEYDWIEKGKYTKISELFEWERFKELRHYKLNITKYILMRVDIALAKLLGLSSLLTNSQSTLLSIFNVYGRSAYGLHLEHMYAVNDRNQKLFLNPETEEFDSIKFQEIRNKYGALLLLKDKHNLSSNNDVYEDKIEIYNGSAIIWNQLLIGAINEIDLKKIKHLFTFTSYEPDENGLLPLEAVSQRQKEIFDVIKYIWGF